jgi:hypothetical protein
LSERIVVLAAILSFCLKVFLASNTYGTNDMLFYEAYWKKSLEADGGAGLYRDGIELQQDGRVYRHEHYMNPPFVIHGMRLAGWFANKTNLPFAFWMRLPSIGADAGILILFWFLAPPSSVRACLAFAVLALSPVSILISGFHGSTDSVMILFVLLSVWLLEKKNSVALAGLALGMSLNVKIWPVILIPAILAWLPSLRSRASFAGFGAAAFAAGSMPFLWQAPGLIFERLLGYSSIFGVWGVGRFLSWLSSATGFSLFNDAFRSGGRYLAVGALASLGVWIARRYPRTPLAVRLGLLSSLFLVLTPGFGVQYLAWVAPWAVLLGPEALLLFQFAGTVFLVSVYNFWSGAFPWYLANSLVKGTWKQGTIFYELLCWVSILVMTLLFHQMNRTGANPPHATPQKPSPKSRRR